MNLNDPGDDQGFPDNSAFNDFLLHGFKSSQQMKGFSFSTDMSPNDLSLTDLSPNDLSLNDMSPNDLFLTDMSPNDLSNKKKFNTTKLSKQERPSYISFIFLDLLNITFVNYI